MKQIKLHLGCWRRHIPGFIHIDIADFPHIDYKRSIDNLPMFEDNTVGLIYSSHSLEYFDRQEAILVLEEWYRVLKPMGTLRIAVPDFKALCNVYIQHKNLDLILGPLYGRMEIHTPEKENLYHKTVYDFESLKTLLKSIGFKNIRHYEWRKTIHKDYDDFSQAYIPHMDKESGMLISLNVECKK